MTENSYITPELARRVLTHLEHSKYIGPDGGLNALFTVKDAVENWETDVGSNDLAARLAASMLNAHEGHAHAYENAMGRWREAWDGHAKVALEFLASIGRLIPADGMALTAERLAELIKHAPAPNVGDYNDGYVAALTDLRDALFPATEPAECEHRCDEGIARAGVGVRCPACTAVIRDKEATEPAEGEAEAEAQKMRDLSTALRAALGILDPLEGGGWAHAWRTADDLDDCANRISSPVVPASNETEWQSLLAVPKSVVAVKDRNGDKWNRGTNGEFCMRVGCGNGHPDFAPFVAVEEQEA